MVCTVKQVVSNLVASYVIEGESSQYGTAKFTQNFIIGSPCEIRYKDDVFNLKYLSIVSKERMSKKGMAWRLPFLIQKGNATYGTIYGKNSEGSFLSRYGYECLELTSGQTYEMYEIGLGKNGIVYPIYRDGVVVAEIDKGCVVYDNLDVYTIYSIDEEAQKNAILFCLITDANSFANRGEIVKSSVSKVYMKTINKKLCAKYDPDFKERVKNGH